MEKIKVSVILPSLNVIDYIRTAVESVMNQSLKAIEIICVDAGSTDGTLEILREYEAKDSRVKLIISEKKSYGYQMNQGIEKARGEYIGIVETDDYVVPHMFEELYEEAVLHNVDFVKADFYRFTGEGDCISKAYYHLTADSSYYNRVINVEEEMEVFRFIMNTWSGIYNRSFLKKYNIKHNESPGASFQDNGFWFQTFMYAKRAYFVDKPYYMNRRDNPNSSVFSKSKIYCICDEYQYIYNIMKKDIDNYKKFKFIYSSICYQSYKFNIERIGEEYQLEFLKRFQQDFKKIRERGELERALIGSRDWEILINIMNDPLEYYEKEIMLKKKVYEQIAEYDQMIIYGAGMVGRKVLHDLTYRENPVNVICFAVTNKKENVDEYHGVKICEIKDLHEYIHTALVVIATTEQYHGSITDTLKKYKFEHIISIPEFDNEEFSTIIKVEEQLKEWYKKTTGKVLNLEEPSTFNEKIQWLKLNDCSEEKSKMLDRLAVREWIENNIGKQYLVPLIGVFRSFDEINFKIFPQQFVIKATHGSEYHYFVKDKNDRIGFDRATIGRRVEEWLNTNYAYYNGFDMNYRSIEPRIMIEPLVEDKVRHSNYKVLCFNGKPEYIIVDTNKNRYGGQTRDIFDIHWNHQDLSIKYPNAQKMPEKPKYLEEMLRLSKKISGNFKLIRIDWFETMEGLLFNQVSFSPGNGVEMFLVEKYEKVLGDLIII